VAADPGPAVKAGAAGAKGNVLTRKIGPLPGWAWAALGIGGFYLWKKHQASTAAASTAATTASTGDNGAALPTSDTTAPSGYAYQGPGVGDGATGTLPSGARTHHHGSGVASVPSPYVTPVSPTTAVVPTASTGTGATTLPTSYPAGTVLTPAQVAPYTAAGQAPPPGVSLSPSVVLTPAQAATLASEGGSGPDIGGSTGPSPPLGSNNPANV
jgi:hypothetical protein